MVTLNFFPSLAMPVTLDDSLNVMPCLSKMRCTCRQTSLSIPGKIRSSNSTTITLEPRRRHTEPSSSPMTPAPMTSIRSGTSSSTSAPVEETMRFSSMSMPGKRATSEPVAMTIALPSMVSFLPSAVLTSTLPGAAMRPVPWKVSILFFLNRKATPLTLPSTPVSLNFIMAGRSSFGWPTLMPILSSRWVASS